jgi:hypothetical protein
MENCGTIEFEIGGSLFHIPVYDSEPRRENITDPEPELIRFESPTESGAETFWIGKPERIPYADEESEYETTDDFGRLLISLTSAGLEAAEDHIRDGIMQQPLEAIAPDAVIEIAADSAEKADWEPSQDELDQMIQAYWDGYDGANWPSHLSL